MNIAVLLAFQFACPALVGLMVTRYLHVVTTRLLIDMCGTADRAEFWVRVCSVMMMVVPFALVLIAAQSPLRCLPNDAICLELVLRQTLVFTLIGALVTVGAIAGVVGRYLPHGPFVASPSEGRA